MSLSLELASLAYKLGAHRATAAAANLFLARSRLNQKFSVDPQGNWINRQPEATIVSPVIHTMLFGDMRRQAVDYWCHFVSLASGDTVIDVGAGVGEETIVFSKLVGPAGRVISIEAHPATFFCLSESVRRTGLTNVTGVGAAIGHEEGATTIRDGQNYLANSIAATLQTDGVEIPMVTLDSICKSNGLSDVALVKMNIEGAEVSALRGMTEMLKITRNVVVSCHDFIADRNSDDSLRTRDEAEQILRDQGFAVSRRLDHPDPWARDYLYGSRQRNA